MAGDVATASLRFSFAAVTKQLLCRTAQCQAVRTRTCRCRVSRCETPRWVWLVVWHREHPQDLRAPDAPSVLRKEKQATALLPISTATPHVDTAERDSDSETCEKSIIYSCWRLFKLIESGRDCQQFGDAGTKVEFEENPGCRSRLQSSTARGAGQAVRL